MSRYSQILQYQGTPGYFGSGACDAPNEFKGRLGCEFESLIGDNLDEVLSRSSLLIDGGVTIGTSKRDLILDPKNGVVPNKKLDPIPQAK
jgi:hypothetical protein